MDLSGAWGYGAVILPRKLFWQAFVVLEPGDDRVRAAVGRAIAAAATVEDEVTPPEGSLAASLVECMVQKNEIGVAVFASALSEMTGYRFWVVDATQDPLGTVTQVVELHAQTPEAARAEIETRVMPLKAALMLRAAHSE